MQLIDIGVNLTNKRLLTQAPVIIQRALDAGIRHMVVTGTSTPNSGRKPISGN